jgi:hypothetical protein
MTILNVVLPGIVALVTLCLAIRPQPQLKAIPVRVRRRG